MPSFFDEDVRIRDREIRELNRERREWSANAWRGTMNKSFSERSRCLCEGCRAQQVNEGEVLQKDEL